MPDALTDSWDLGGLTVPNRVLLAPLAGIGNWFVRLQAKRYGAGMAVSEMVSSFGVHHGNERTSTEMLRVHPDEQARGRGGERGLVALQLFGQDPDVMRSAAAIVAQRTPVDVIDLNMGCPVPKVCKTGAGAALLKDPDTAVAVARAAREGSGLPVTVKLRSGSTPGDTSGFELAHRLVDEAGVAAIGFHPRSAKVHHKGTPDYALAARLVESLPAPVILTGGLRSPAQVHEAYERTGAAAVMLARGALGNPWLFEQLLGVREADEPPTRDEVLAELHWVMDRCVEHLGEDRAGRYLRKFYPWYLDRLGASKHDQAALQQTARVAEARALLSGLRSAALTA
jgi:tRNA-dihydrouridine synthase B